MIVTVQKDTKRIFDAVSTATELSKPGMGIGYVTPIGEVSGVAENTAAKMGGSRPGRSRRNQVRAARRQPSSFFGPHLMPPSGCADSFR
jgi:hypothetical protein